MAQLRLAREPLGDTVTRDWYAPALLRVVLRSYNFAAAREIEERVGITVSEFAILSTLSNHPGAQASEISATVAIDKSVVSRRLKKLIESGLVAEEADEGLRRLYLTTLGVTIHDSVMPISRELNDRLLAGFSPAEREQLIAYLDRMYDNVPGLEGDVDPR